MISPCAVIVASERQVACTVGDEKVMLHLDQGMYYGLDGVGLLVWDLLGEPRTLTELVDRVVREYDVDRERCAADLEELVEDLRARDLVIIRDGV